MTFFLCTWRNKTYLLTYIATWESHILNSVAYVDEAALQSHEYFLH